MMVAACRTQTDVDLMQVRTDQALVVDRGSAEPFVQTLERQRSSSDLKQTDAKEVDTAPQAKPRAEKKADKPDEIEVADETVATESSDNVNDETLDVSDAEPIAQAQDQEQDDELTDEELASEVLTQQQVAIVELPTPAQTNEVQVEAIAAQPVDQTRIAAATQTAQAPQAGEQTIAASKQDAATSQTAANQAAQGPVVLQTAGTGAQVSTGDSTTDDSASQLPAQPRPLPQPQQTAPAPHATQHSEQPTAPTQTAATVTAATPMAGATAAPAPTASAPSASEGQQPTTAAQTTGQDDSLNAARLARGLNNAVNQRGGVVTLRLTPPEMGTVRIQMQITGTQVSVRFHAETNQGQAMLAQNLGQLRQTLEGQGLHVDRISVQTMQPQHSASSNHTGTQQDQQRTDSQQHDARADDGRSRGSFDRRQDARDGDRRQREQQNFDFQQMLREGKQR